MNPSYQFTPLVLPLLAPAVFTAALLAYVWQRRNVPGATPFGALLFCATIVILGNTFQQAAIDPPTKIMWFKLQSIWQLPYACLQPWFALDYANLRRWLTRRTFVLLAIPSLLFPLLVFTNDTHRLVWTGFVVDGYVHPVRGIVNWIGVGYGSLLIVATTLVFVWLLFQSPFHRLPIALVLCGLLASMGTYVANALTDNPMAQMNPVFLVMVFSSALYALALFRFRMFDFLPVARATVVHQMREGMLVLDAQLQIADLNPAAETILGVSAAHAKGQKATRWLPSLNSELESLPIPMEIAVGPAEPARFHTLYLSPLQDQRGLPYGYLILLRDITEQRQAQARLAEQQRVVAALEEREHLARELHDGLAQMLAAAHMQASAAKELLGAGAHAQASECLDVLAQMTLEMESEVREYLLGARTFVTGDQSLLAALREYLVRFGRQYGLGVDLAVPPELQAAGFTPAVDAQLVRIIQEALANIRKHAHAQCVSVDFAVAGSQARIVIADDGAGFDPGAMAAGGGGFGLRSMRERAQVAGGNLQVVSKPGQGTRVIVQLPLKQANGETTR